MNRARNFATAVAALAAITWYIRPRTNELLTAQSNVLSGMVKAATSGAGPLRDLRSAAERFAHDAHAAISEFWEGFTE